MKTNKEIVEEFMGGFVLHESKMTKSGQEIQCDPNYLRRVLSQTLTTRDTELRKAIEGMRRKKGFGDYVLSDQNAWYNQAIKDILTLLKEREI